MLLGRWGNLVAACTMYMLVGPALILLNRYILKELDFNYPATVSGLGMLFSGAISIVAVDVLKVAECKHREHVTQRFYLTRIVPVAACSVATLYTGNRVYLYLSVSLIQMLKAFTPVFIVAFLYMFKVSKPTQPLIGAVMTICVGTSLTSLGAVDGSLVGIALMMSAEIFESMKLVASQTLISSQGMKFSIMESLYWLAPPTAAGLGLILIPLLELPRMIHEGSIAIPMAHPLPFICSGCLGFCVNFSSFFVMQTSSALVLKLLGTLRNISLIGFSIFFYSEDVSAEQVVGFTIALAGFAWFQWLKLKKRAEVPFFEAYDAQASSVRPADTGGGGEQHEERSSMLRGGEGGKGAGSGV